MMLGETPTVRPALALAVGALDHHARDRAGAGVGRQDADLVVDQPHVRQLRDRPASSALRSAVSSAFTGPLPSATVISCSPPTSSVIVASDSVDQLAARIPAPLVHDAEALTAEVIGHAAAARGAPAARSWPRRRHRRSRRTRATSPSRPAPRPWDRRRRPRGRSRGSAPGCWRGRTGRRRRCGGGCRPASDRYARRCADPSRPPRHAGRPCGRRRESPT